MTASTAVFVWIRHSGVSVASNVPKRTRLVRLNPPEHTPK